MFESFALANEICNIEALIAEKDKSKCLVREKALMELLRPLWKYNFNRSLYKILSYKFFDLIRENHPNIIFIEYRKSDEL